MKKDWSKYQDRVARYFRKLGCKATVNKRFKGARASHLIDVVVEFKKYGINVLWIVECKYWKSKVPKEKVLALKSLVGDVGADKGFIITEIGFQKGAKDSALATNIYLATWKEFVLLSKDEFINITLDKLENQLIILQERLFSCRIVISERKSPKDGHSGEFKIPEGSMSLLGRVSILIDAIKKSKINCFPVLVDFIGSGDEEKGMLVKSKTEVVNYLVKKVPKLCELANKVEENFNKMKLEESNRPV